MSENRQPTDLSRFNEKYLKCIVTKRPSTMRVLKDHGAIIVYQNSGYNFLYLGDEFIASGYGFKTQEELNSAVEIINKYASDNESINNKLEELEEALNNITQNVQDMLDDYKPIIYVKDKNGTEALLNELFFHGKTAEYKDFEITSISKTITYNNNKTITIPADQNVIDFPLGTIIRKVSYTLHCELNDCGGIDHIYTSFYKNSEDSVEGNVQTNEINRVQWQNLSKQKSLIISHEFTDPFIVDMNTDVKLINNVRIDIAETTKEQYKPYPELELTEGESFEIYSLENIIRKHSLYIDPLWIHPTLSIRYYLETEAKDINYIKKNIIENRTATDPNKGEIEIKNLAKGDVNDLYIDIERLNIKKIHIFVPVSCTMHAMHYITEHSDYNWSGAVGVLTHLSNMRPITLFYNRCDFSGEEKLIYIQYNMYQLQISPETDTMLTDFGKLHLRLFMLNDQFNTDLYIGDGNIQITEPGTWELLNNEDFNRIYWLSYQDLGEYESNINALEDEINRCYGRGITNPSS